MTQYCHFESALSAVKLIGLNLYSHQILSTISFQHQQPRRPKLFIFWVIFSSVVFKLPEPVFTSMNFTKNLSLAMKFQSLSLIATIVRLNLEFHLTHKNTRNHLSPEFLPAEESQLTSENLEVLLSIRSAILLWWCIYFRVQFAV